MESMTGYGESHFSLEGTQIICSARSLNSRFLEIDLHFPEELVWFRAHAEEIIRKRFGRGRIEIHFQSAASLPVEMAFNTEILSQYERFLAQRLGKKKYALDPREFLNVPGFVERRLKNWRSYQNKFDFHLLRALIKMQRGRAAEGKQITRACMTHLRYLARVQRQLGVLQTQAYRKKLITLRHRIYADFFAVPDEIKGDTSPNDRDKMRIAKLIWNERKDEILRAVHNDASEEISRIAMHIKRMLEIFKQKQSAGREIEFFLQELQRETNTLGAKAQDGEINTLAIIMKTEIERLREQVRNLE
jgi:uncharacterized protein (TIGR00255 family)